MGLKQIIKQQKLLASGAVDMEFELPGEPLIYSIKYPIGNGSRSAQFFRNEKWRSLLKCHFTSYYRTNTPVVIVVHFFVSPPSSVKIKKADLKKENVPAVSCYEVCDYLLSFLEVLHHVLFNSYRQVVKLEVEKYYSDNPRTVFKFMKWDHYVNLQNNNTLYTESKGICTDGQEPLLQSKRKRNVKDKNLRETTIARKKASIDVGAIACDSALQDTRAFESSNTSSNASELHATHQEA